MNMCDSSRLQRLGKTVPLFSRWLSAAGPKNHIAPAQHRGVSSPKAPFRTSGSDQEMAVRGEIWCPCALLFQFSMQGSGLRSEGSLMRDNAIGDESRSEERRVGKECRSRWS